MKIRSDFVTNSSSSSFTITLDIKLKDGKVLRFCDGRDGDDGAIFGKLYPAELAAQKSIEDLIALLRKNVYLYDNYLDEGKIYPFDPESPLYPADYDDNAPEKMVNALRELKGMEDIASITVEGMEEYANGEEPWTQTWSYDMETGEESFTEEGERLTDYDGGSGGSLNSWQFEQDDE